MTETEDGRHPHDGAEHESVPQSVPLSERPYWKRAHHDWRFWAGLLFMLAAVAIYILSDGLALLPGRQAQPASQDSGAPLAFATNRVSLNK
jgi:hypothetical protein